MLQVWSQFSSQCWTLIITYPVFVFEQHTETGYLGSTQNKLQRSCSWWGGLWRRGIRYIRRLLHRQYLHNTVLAELSFKYLHFTQFYTSAPQLFTVFIWLLCFRWTFSSWSYEQLINDHALLKVKLLSSMKRGDKISSTRSWKFTAILHTERFWNFSIFYVLLQIFLHFHLKTGM